MSVMLLAWSWDGHGSLTATAVASAVAYFVRVARPELLSRFDLLRISMAAGRRENAFKNLATAPKPSVPHLTNVMTALFKPLPTIVQNTDIHVGNIPFFGLGEFLDSAGQVRHFMRSTPGTSERQAYTAAVGWIRSHMTESWADMHRALYTNYTFGAFDLFSAGNGGDFRDGLTALGEALHTVEDSYAPGHVARLAGQPGNIMRIYYWDDANKNPGPNWPGHSALDNPTTAQSKVFYAAAGVTANELLIQFLLSLDGTPAAYAAGLQKLIDLRFHLAGRLGTP